MVQKVFPGSFVGLMACGNVYHGNFGMTYRLYVDNNVSNNMKNVGGKMGKALGGPVLFYFPKGFLWTTSVQM